VIRLLPDVKLDNLTTQTLLALTVCDGVFGRNGIDDCIVTSCSDGIHSPTSLHYAGNAFDLRLHHIPEILRGAILADMRSALTVHYDTLRESNHYHIEYQPRR